MADIPQRQPRFAQRKRIFPRRSEIYALLDDGFPVREIRTVLGFEDIPLRTFEKNVAALRELRRTGKVEVTSPMEPEAPAPPRGQEDAGPKPTRRRARKGPIIPEGVTLPKGRDAAADRPEPLKPEDYM